MTTRLSLMLWTSWLSWLMINKVKSKKVHVLVKQIHRMIRQDKVNKISYHMTRISALRALSLKPLKNGHVMGSVRLFATGPFKPVFSRLEVPRAFIYLFFTLKNTVIKCLLTELGRAVRENIWISVICAAATSQNHLNFALRTDLFTFFVGQHGCHYVSSILIGQSSARR